MKIKRKLHVILLSIFLFSLLGCMEEIESIEINNVDVSKIEDGEYIGEHITTLVGAKVKVRVKEGQIIKVDILEHKNGRGKKAESIVDRVIEEQRVEVDVVSGATGSSKVILKAIEKALVNSK